MMRRSVLALAGALVLLAESAFAVNIETVTSKSGVTAWLVRDPSIPLISMEFSFRDSGASRDPAGKEGLANLVSALLDEGAGDLGSQAFQRQLENQSIQLGFNAGKDTFSGSLKTLNKYRDNAVRLLALALSKPRFDKDAVERIRSQMLTGLKARSARPGYIAGRVWARAIYGDHVYGRPVHGTQTTVAAIKTADLKEYVATRLSRDRLIVSVVGDITPEQLKPMLDRIFGALPAKGVQTDIGDAAVPSKGAVYVIRRPVPQSVVVFGQRGLTRDDPDFYAAYVLNHILGGGTFTSRLYNEVREKRGLAYSVYTYLSPRDHAPLLGGRMATANDGVARSVAVLREEWQRLAKDGVSAAELEDAKRYINGSFPLRCSSSDRIAGLLVTLQYYKLGIDYIGKRKELIDGVTREQVNALAKKLLNPDALTVTIVGDPSDIEPTAQPPKLEY
jgi:zinc protease